MDMGRVWTYVYSGVVYVIGEGIYTQMWWNDVF